MRTGHPMNVSDRLRVHSVTKTSTAMVILQVAAEHHLSIDSTVDHHLLGPIGELDQDGRRISVRQLLQHKGGLPDYIDAPQSKRRTTAVPPLRTAQPRRAPSSCRVRRAASTTPPPTTSPSA
ncbi:serine hydrolase [Streptomyces krungchingensis]|uniref:serine hydrolase n=1 Tax=Streptomyces krungchingensis TaxID=1565034 RepID=UPI003CF0E74F